MADSAHVDVVEIDLWNSIFAQKLIIIIFIAYFVELLDFILGYAIRQFKKLIISLKQCSRNFFYLS